MIDIKKIETYVHKVDEVQELKDKLANKRVEFDNENDELIQTIKLMNEGISEIKDVLKAEGLDEYKETDSKKLTGGLGIRVCKLMEYDPEKAFGWAVEHNMCLALDKKRFEKIANAEKISFVEISENVIVTFPSKIKMLNDDSEVLEK